MSKGIFDCNAVHKTLGRSPDSARIAVCILPRILGCSQITCYDSSPCDAQLRTPYLDKFLPPRKKQGREPPRAMIELDFLHYPIVDLGLPDEGMCVEAQPSHASSDPS